MPISKEKWTEIEQTLKGFCFTVQFQYGEYKISIERVRASENQMVLCVYIDGEIKGGWFTGDNERPACIPDVWRKRTKAVYSAKFIKQVEKIYGKRKCKVEYPDLHSKQIYHDCTFNTAKSLVSQFKKLANLELLEAS